MPLELIERLRAVLVDPGHPERLQVLAELERYRRRATPLLFQPGDVDASGVRIYRIGTAADYRDIALLHPLIWILHRLAAGGTLPLAVITSAKAARQAARNQLNAARMEVARHCPELAAALVFAISDKHSRVSMEGTGRMILTG